jgi:5-methylcytosine-specific restriction enzyme subunit McrC
VGSIQVYEHQRLQLGDQVNGLTFTASHFQALINFHHQRSTKYYKLIHRGVQFSHYVGVLQVGELTIEILPKIGQHNSGKPAQWQRLLIDMLAYCQFIKLEAHTTARQSLQPNAILDLYLSIFVSEVEQLMRQGLIKQYYRDRANLKSLKGRLVIPVQIRKNIAHQERFFVDVEQYGYDHLLHQIIGAALQMIQRLPISAALYARVSGVLNRFPAITIPVALPSWYDLRPFDRKQQPYRKAVDIALMLLHNYHPGLRAGSHHVLAILFDMNLLFEEYIYQQLLRQSADGVSIYRQLTKAFWGRRFLKPDLLVVIGQERFVLDTKWKLATRAAPSMADLRQVYAYTNQFDAKHGVLLYPAADSPAATSTRAIPFEPGLSGNRKIDCQLLFVQLMKAGRLNRQIGEELLEIMSKHKMAKASIRR